jgi:hypothetical protein
MSVIEIYQQAFCRLTPLYSGGTFLKPWTALVYNTFTRPKRMTNCSLLLSSASPLNRKRDLFFGTNFGDEG